MKLFDATLYTNKPLLPAAFVPIRGVYEQYFFDADTINTAKLAPYLTGQELVFFDCERPSHFTPDMWAQVGHTADLMGTAPHGFFSMPTPPWGGRYTPEWSAWIDTFGPALRNSDAIFPCAYAYSTDPVAWVKSFDIMIEKSRSMAPGKPVYPFIWWTYMDESLGYVGDNYWRLMLNQCRRKADGAVIWGGYTEVWSDAYPWWLIAKNYCGA